MTISKIFRFGLNFLRNEADITWSLLKHNCLTNIIAPTAAAAAGWLWHHGPESDPLSLVGVFMAFVWSFLTLYWVDMPNQLKGVDEDRINKPSRPIPRGILTVKGGIARWILCTVLYAAISWYYSVVLISTAWVLLMILYVFTPILHVHWFTKNVVFLTLAFFILNCGAWNFVAPMTPAVAFYFASVAFIVSCTYIVQDLRDAEGDRTKNRLTMPIVWGDRNARIFSFVISVLAPLACGLLFAGAGSMLMWPEYIQNAVPLSIRLGWNGVNIITCLAIALLTIFGTPKGTDQLTYNLVESHFVFLSGSASFFVSYI